MAADHQAYRPRSGVTRRVWEIADNLTASLGRQPNRRDVLDAAAREGIHTGTASKQYNDWRLFNKAPEQTGAAGVNEAPVAPVHMPLHIASDGRVLIPAEFRSQMKLDDSGRLTASLVDGELRLISPAVALDQLDRLFAPLRGDLSVVDELLAERRAEAERE